MDPKMMRAADRLFQAKALSPTEYQRVNLEVQRTGQRSEEMLLALGIFDETQLLRSLSNVYRTRFVSTERLSKADVPKAAIECVPRQLAETRLACPVLFDAASGTLGIATPDGDDTRLAEELRAVAGVKSVLLIVARPAGVKAALAKHYGGDPRAFAGLLDGSMAPPAPAPQAAYGAAPAAFLDPPIRPAGAAPQVVNVPNVLANIPAAVLAMDPFGSTQVSPGVPNSPAPKPEAIAPPTTKLSPNVPEPRKTTKIDRADIARAGDAPQATVRGAEVPQGIDPTTMDGDGVLALVQALVMPIEERVGPFRGHAALVAKISKMLGEDAGLPATERYALLLAAWLHDLGRSERGHLTARSVSRSETHARAALEVVDVPLKLLADVPLPEMTRRTIRHVWERVDGEGIPDGLRGSALPRTARIVALADVIADLMENPANEVGRRLNAQEAIDRIEATKGTVFDSALFDLARALVTSGRLQ